MNHGYMRRPWTFIRIREFFPPINIVSWWHETFQWRSAWCSRWVFIVRKMTTTGAAHLIQTFFFWWKSRLLWFARLLTLPQTSSCYPNSRCHWKESDFRQESTLWKSDQSTKHNLTQMLLAINWHYWQAGKNSHKRMKVQGRLMQVRFIEIHQVSAKTNKVWHFSNSELYNRSVISILLLH